MVIGLDGAAFGVVDALMAEGRLPHIAALIERGTRSPLLSTIPISSWPAWTAMMTGKYPGKHGVYHYHLREGYRERVVSARDVGAETLWEALSRNGRRVAVIGVPVTFPPARVNGVLVSGLPMPPGLHAYPPEVGTELSLAAAGYPSQLTGSDWARIFRVRGAGAVARHCERSLDLSLRAALHLWRREAWDAFVCVFCELDRVQHLTPWPQDPNLPGADQRRALVACCYEKADQVVGELLAAAGEEVTVALVSDHGFGENRKVFHLNRFLAHHGLLAVRSKAGKALRVVRRTVDETLGAFGSGIGGRFGSLPLWFPRWERRPALEMLDWGATRAFAATADLDGVYINLRGREPHGVVEPGAAYEETREALIAALQEVRDPDTGEPVVAWARRREEVFRGPFLERAPDVIYMTRDNSYPMSGRLDPGPALSTNARGRTGGHRREGVFVLAGPAARRGAALERCHIVDVAPTLLHAAGVPIAEDVCGEVLLAALDQDYLGHRPVEFVKPALPAVIEGADYSPEEQRALEEQLRRLGYYA